MSLIGRILTVGWMTIVLAVQMSVAKHSRWALNTKPRVLWDLSAEELECVHDFLMSRRELELQPSTVLTLAKNSVFLIEMLMPKKYEVLAFLDKGAMPPLREARVLIYFGAQEYPNVTEYAVGPVDRPVYMRKLNRKGGQELSWVSRPMSKVESALLFHTLKTATKPLQEFFFDTTGFTLQDCNGGCLTFTNVGPRGMTFRNRHSWFLLQRFMNDHFLQPTGLEILVDHGSTDVQDWRVVQLWYNDKFYNSPEELARKYADGEVDIVVLEDPLPKASEQSPQLSTYKPHAEFLMPIDKGGPRVVQPYPEFPTPIRRGVPRVSQPYSEFPTPIRRGVPQVTQPYSEFLTPIRRGVPRVTQPYSEFPTPIRRGVPRVTQPYSEFPTPIRRGVPRVTQPYSEFPKPIRRGGPRVTQPYSEFPKPIRRGGPRVTQPYSEFSMPIRKGGPRVTQPYSEFSMPISKGGPRVAQPYPEFPRPISKGGPPVVQPYPEFSTPIRKGGPRVAQLYPEFSMPISKGGPRVAQPYPEFPRPISKGGPPVVQPYPEFSTPIRKGGPRVAQLYPEFSMPISKGGPRVAQPYPEFPRPISKGGLPVVQPYPEFFMPIRKGGPRVAEPNVPHYRLKHNTVLYGDWSFFFKLQSSYGLQLFNVHFRGERIAYEVGVQEVMALYKGHTAGGRETKYVDVGWGLGGITHQLIPGIDCPHEATFLDAIHYYDSDGPVLSRKALCIFEVPAGVPLRHYFNSNFRSSFSSYARLGGPMLVLRTASTIHNHDYIWDFIFHSNGIMEGKMYATGYVHATFYTSEGVLYHSRLHTHLLDNVHSHLAHYRIDLDVAGTKNSFQTLKMRLENITDPWSQSSQQVQPILDKTQYSRERQAAFHFRQTLPKYLLFSNTGKSVLGRSHSYRLHVPSMAEQMLPPGWQNSPAFTWPRYQLAVTKYQESERFHSSLYNQNHHWAYPMVFENFIHNNENIEDEDLVAWVTVGLSNNLHSENAPSMATPRNAAGFLLQPFDLYDSFQRYTGTKATQISGTRSLQRSTQCLHSSAILCEAPA